MIWLINAVLAVFNVGLSAANENWFALAGWLAVIVTSLTLYVDERN